MSASTKATLVESLNALLAERALPPPATWDDATVLFGEKSIGLDSLDMAVLSSQLEARLGRDPYSRGQFPRTLGELLQFYASP